MTLVRIGLVQRWRSPPRFVANIVLLNIARGAHEPVGNLRLSTVVQSTPAQGPVPAETTSVRCDLQRGELNDD
jgi:hypothetical protein